MYLKTIFCLFPSTSSSIMDLTTIPSITTKYFLHFINDVANHNEADWLFGKNLYNAVLSCESSLHNWFFLTKLPHMLHFSDLKTMCIRGLLYVSANVCRATFCSFTGYLACISCTFHSMGVFVQPYVCSNVCVNAVTGEW